MKIIVVFFYLLIQFPFSGFSEPSVSPVLYYLRHNDTGKTAKAAQISETGKAKVSLRFRSQPDENLIEELELHGLEFRRKNGAILHTKSIYFATVVLDSLETLATYESILSIESAYNPSRASTLDVSNPMVQASRAWNLSHDSFPVDGTGVVLADVDTGIDIYHPAFFKPDGGSYTWIDVDESGHYENGVDAVDINGNNVYDEGESLCFFNAGLIDPFEVMSPDSMVYEADYDWLYNDQNGNGIRDYGAENGFTEDSPSYGELFFIVSDDNGNNRLDVGEQLTALGTSKILATYDKNGEHYRGVNLFDTIGDTTNHGTPAMGVAGGQVPGRKFTGMAPGIEFISIDRSENDEEVMPGVLWAIKHGADIVMYEFGSWIFEFLDGTSDLEIFIGELYDQGIHQFTAAGNLSGPTRRKHAYFELPYTQSDTLHFSIPEVHKINEIYLSFLMPLENPNIPYIILKLSDTESIVLDGNNEQTPTTIGKYNVWSGMDGPSSKNSFRIDAVIESETIMAGEMSLIFKNRRSGLTYQIDSYISDDKTAWMNGAHFLNHDTDDGTVCSPGTAEKGITVGSFDPRGYRDPVGEFSDFSSWGETIDGRRAVDITAPGYTVFTPSSHEAVGGQPGAYVSFTGTSAALPHVAGCAALIIQSAPDISPDDLSQVLFTSALEDDFTGEVPNNKWGYGKLQIYDSLIDSNIATYVADAVVQETFSISNPYPNPFNTSITFDVICPSGSNSALNLSIYNSLGQKIRTIRDFSVQASIFPVSWNGIDDSGLPVASGIYFFHFVHNNISQVRKALFLK